MDINEPENIGGLTVKNRIVMAPMISNLANPDGSTNEIHGAYLEERAAGGTGLIITEYTYINDRNSRGSPNEMGFYDRSFIPKLRRLTERIHRHGTAVFAQLVHAGGKALSDFNREESVAPSSVDYLGIKPRELTGGEIHEIEEDFVKAAKIARDSRFDGVEIHGAHGYLVQEFISPALNARTDAYGGSFQNRIRFANEIVESVKEEIDFPVGIRLSLYEDDPDGYGPEYGLKVAESLGRIDYVHFSAGRFSPPGSSASFYEPSVHIARRLPRKPSVKTMIVGSVRNRADVMEVLGRADFVSVGRALLADPYFPAKVMEDNTAIRPCIRCNQGCRDLSLGEVRCTVNPDTGFEADTIREMPLTGEVVIVGAGVKGLEAAMTAARSGLNVILYEKEERIGGQLLKISDKMKRVEFLDLVKYYESAALKLELDIRTGEKYSGEGIYCLPDRVYPSIRGRNILRIDSNIYQHHDEVLELAETENVILSSRSLKSLDRVRRTAFENIARKLPITVTDDMTMKFDISINEREQYDIRAAMVSGRNTINEYIKRNKNLYL